MKAEPLLSSAMLARNGADFGWDMGVRLGGFAEALVTTEWKEL